MTTQPPHVALDEAIVAAIAEGPKTFGAIQNARGTRDIKFDRPAEGQPKCWMLA
jgi:hypothetical protein